MFFYLEIFKVYSVFACLKKGIVVQVVMAINELAFHQIISRELEKTIKSWQ